MASEPEDIDDIFGQANFSVVSIKLGVPADAPEQDRKHSMRFSAPPPKKVRRGAGELLAAEKQRSSELKEEVKRLMHENKMLQRKLGGVDGQAITQIQSVQADHQNTMRLRKHFQQQSIKVEHELAHTKEQLQDEQQLRTNLQNDLELISKEMDRLKIKVAQKQGVVDRQIEKVDVLRAREREVRASTVGRDAYDLVLSDLDVARNQCRELKDDKEQLERQKEELEEQAEEKQLEFAEALKETSSELVAARADPFGRRANETKASAN